MVFATIRCTLKPCPIPVRHDAVCVNNIIMVQHAVRVNSVIYKTCSLFRRHLVMPCNENMTLNDRNLCTFDFRRFLVLYFPAMHFCPSFSCPAFSSPSLLSVIFQSCIFHPSRYFIVRHFPVLHFQRPLDRSLLIDVGRSEIYLFQTTTIHRKKHSLFCQ